MNIFGIGTAEFVLIILIMLVVAGPKRMVRWAYIVGQYMGKLRQMWEEVVDVMQKEADAAGLDVQIPHDPPSRQNIDKWVRDVAKPYSESLQQVSDELTQPVKDAMSETATTLKEADQVTRAATASTAAAAATTNSRSRATKALPPRKPPEGAIAQSSNGSQNAFGSWGQSPTTPEPEANGSSTEDKMNYGAWSKPQHPATPTEETE